MMWQPARTIQLPEYTKGEIGGAAIHHDSGWLFVARPGGDCVDVVHGVFDVVLYSVPELRGASAVVVGQELNEVFVANRDEHKISFFQVIDRSAEKMVVGRRPQALAWDAQRGTLWVGNAGRPNEPRDCAISVVDFLRRTMVIATIPLAGQPQALIYDAGSDAAYVASTATAEVAVLEGREPAQIARALAAPPGEPLRLAADPERGRLLCACGDGTLLAMDARSGAIQARTPLAAAPGSIAFDAVRDRVLAAYGSRGALEVLDAASLETVQTLPTEEGADQMVLDSERGKLYVLCPMSQSALVFEAVRG